MPLSYGLRDVRTELLNAVEFRWDATKLAGVFIKINCISTEFTPKKHGGEKGVPFRSVGGSVGGQKGVPLRSGCGEKGVSSMSVGRHQSSGWCGGRSPLFSS